MSDNNCKCSSEKQISASSIENAQELLRQMAPSKSSTYIYEESIAYRNGHFLTSLKISKRNATQETILVAAPQSLGIIAVSAVPITKKNPDKNKLEFRLEVHAGIGPAKKTDLIGKANIVIYNHTSEITAESLQVLGEGDGESTSMFRKRIDWGKFKNCAVANCLGWGTCLPFIGSKIGCIYCLVECAIDSIVDD